MRISNTQFRCIRTTITALVILFACLASNAQVDSLNAKFSAYREIRPIEKIFVHMNRTTHVCGETLWFKLYCVNGATHRPMDLSKVAYIEVLSDNGESVLQSKVELAQGRGCGSVQIPVSLNTGNYTLRAYTQWMKNEDPEFFFHQPITIINTFRGREPAYKPEDVVTLDAQFMPEGGNLVDGIESIVGFRVVNQFGKGVNFRGSIMSGKGDTILVFQPAQFGIGAFRLTPKISESYRVVIEDGGGKSHAFPFPKVFESGYTLAVTRSESNVKIKVHAKLPQFRNVHVFIHTRNQIVYSRSEELSNGELTLTIPERHFDAGVSHITLFDAQMKPVCERLLFKRAEKKLNITVHGSDASYRNRQKITLSFNVADELAGPSDADMSLAVYKIDSLAFFRQPSIDAYLLMSSDLQGTIESPDTYFEPGREELVDQVMLTHGWRRFRWDDILGRGKPLSFQPEVLGLSLTGKVTTASGSPASALRLFLSVPSKNNLFFTANTLPDGTFNFLLKNVYGDRRIILQSDMTKDSVNVYSFQLTDPFVKVANKIYSCPLALMPTLEKPLITRSMNMQVEDIFRKDKTPVSKSVIDSTAFYGKADETYLLDDYTRFTVMDEVLREYVPGVIVKVRRKQFLLGVRDIVNHGTFDDEPLRLVDGVPFFDTDKIMQFDPLKVKKLEVVSKAFFHGPAVFPGIVSFTTYEGDLAGIVPDPRSLTIDFAGLQAEREFYQPRYDDEADRLSREPDSRTLLLWAPDIKTSNGKASVDFYSSDESGYFQIEATCLSAAGRMGSFRGTFLVK